MMPEKPKFPLCERYLPHTNRVWNGTFWYPQNAIEIGLKRAEREGAKAEREKILHKMSMISANCPEGELKQYWGLKAELEKEVR